MTIYNIIFKNVTMIRKYVFLAILLANHPALKPKDFDCLKVIVNGAASLGTLDQAKLHKKAERNIPILQGRLNICHFENAIIIKSPITFDIFELIRKYFQLKHKLTKLLNCSN